MESLRSRPKFSAPGLLAVGVAAAIAAGCGGGADSTTGTEAPVVAKKREKPAAKVEPKTPGCKRVKTPKPQHGIDLNVPKMTTEKGDRMIATVKTTCGSFVIELDTRTSLKTVNSFASMGRRGLYEGLTFDRIAPGKMIQGGDPAGDGANSSGPGYFIDEKPPADVAYSKWTVAMSQRLPPTEPAGHSRSQFFVVLADELDLAPVFAPIGKVATGFDVVERIAKQGTASEKPRKPVVIEWVWARKGKP